MGSQPISPSQPGAIAMGAVSGPGPGVMALPQSPSGVVAVPVGQFLDSVTTEVLTHARAVSRDPTHTNKHSATCRQAFLCRFAFKAPVSPKSEE